MIYREGDKAGMGSNRFGVYRERLIKKGVAVSTEYM